MQTQFASVASFYREVVSMCHFPFVSANSSPRASACTERRVQVLASKQRRFSRLCRDSNSFASGFRELRHPVAIPVAIYFSLHFYGPIVPRCRNSCRDKCPATRCSVASASTCAQVEFVAIKIQQPSIPWLVHVPCVSANQVRQSASDAVGQYESQLPTVSRIRFVSCWFGL